MRKLITIITLLFAFATGSQAQDLAIKSNLVNDLTTTINLGIEVGLSPKWTLDFSGNINPWDFHNGLNLRHWLAEPEVRLWCKEKWAGPFFGLHLLAGQYTLANLKNNLKFLGTDFSVLSDKRYTGLMAGGGIGFGYSVIIKEHFNIEFEIGVGYIYSLYDIYEGQDQRYSIASDQIHHYYGPTKAAISLVYLF